MLAEITPEAASDPLALTKKLFERPDDGRIKCMSPIKRLAGAAAMPDSLDHPAAVS
jgi:hypothetical protein